MIAPIGIWPGRGFPGVRRAPLLIWVLGPEEPGSGDKMAIGVSRRARPLILGRLSSRGAGSNKVAGADRGFIGYSGATRSPGVTRSGGGGEDLVVEVAQGVVAAAGELAGHRQQRQLAAETGLDLLEVGVVG